MLSAREKKKLIEIAWKSIRRAVCTQTGESSEQHSLGAEGEGALSERVGVFVTLHKNNRLRGCLGWIVSDMPLAETVNDIAGRSATEDPRFPSVTEEELADIRVELSILSPLKEISSIEEIQVGTHGLFIQAGMYRGLLLPQVAVEQGWDRKKFLEETCAKAGLPSDQWKHSETRIYIFSAEIIEQETP